VAALVERFLLFSLFIKNSIPLEGAAQAEGGPVEAEEEARWRAKAKAEVGSSRRKRRSRNRGQS